MNTRAALVAALALLVLSDAALGRKLLQPGGSALGIMRSDIKAQDEGYGYGQWYAPVSIVQPQVVPGWYGKTTTIMLPAGPEAPVVPQTRVKPNSRVKESAFSTGSAEDPLDAQREVVPTTWVEFGSHGQWSEWGKKKLRKLFH